MPTTPFSRMAAPKREALIAAAAAEFAAHSFAEASLNRIVTSCRMSKSSFYHVVESKEELLGLVVTELIAEARADWPPPAVEDFAGDFWATAERVWRDAVEVWPRSTALNLLWRIFSAHREHPAVEQAGAVVDAWLTEVLEIGRRSGAVDAECPQELQALGVQSLLRSFDEWSLRQAQGPGGIDAAWDSGLVADQFRLLRRLIEA
ncbi:TetR family transcriptional regulator [Brevibacterium sanguinis]|uniref:TetR family transcriptional regulator n=2 Tax=Brevibacterium TaxID=1696 RepID=A0A366ILX9_9MICO|nr:MULTISPECIES: TetR/AcrR family transcriptional regulator [Brevibacterium]RBP66230.1 TetR family transcriptional regulator [Brevibacterium sanguinis]RBP72881.1 TetR family transcriptional regulator [Brevibacterium celere]